eukprot:gene35343-43577_t
MTYENGDEYTGAWLNDEIRGIGVYRTANGDQYSGNWFVDKSTMEDRLVLRGYAKIQYANGDRFEGQMDRGQNVLNGT